MHRNPFTEALVYVAVLCQLSFSLITSTIFIEFLKQLYPAIEKILLSASNIARKYIIDMYNARKLEKQQELVRVKGMIYFSFNL